MANDHRATDEIVRMQPLTFHKCYPPDQGRVMSFLAQFRAVLGREHDDATRTAKPDEQDESGTGENDIPLSQCPSCETVYLGLTENRCSKCEISLDEVGRETATTSD